MLAFLSSIGPLEIAIIGAVALLLFGSRLPTVARGVGRSITEFKKGLSDVQSEVKEGLTEDEKSHPQS